MKKVLTCLVLVGAACGRDSSRQADSTAPTRRPETSAAVSATASTASPAPPAGVVHAVQVSVRGIGPIKIGMTLAEARLATAGTLSAPPAADTASCGFARWPRGLPGLRFMTANGRIVRVDVDSGSTSTVEGARIGDSESHIGDLYSAQFTVTPSKYAKGHTMTVTPRAAADTASRLVFETDGVRVKSYRAGRLPEVAYVEGCG